MSHQRSEAERNLWLAAIERMRDQGQCGIGYVHLCSTRRWNSVGGIIGFAALVAIGVVGVVTAAVVMFGR